MYKKIFGMLLFCVVTAPVYAMQKQIFGAYQKSKDDASIIVERLRLAAALGDKKTVTTLIASNRACVNAGHPLRKAIEAGQIATAQVLIDQNANLETRFSMKKSLLHLTAEKEGSWDMVQFLVDNGATIDASDFNYNTPLYSAVRAKSEQSVSSLVYSKASTGIIENMGASLLDRASKEEPAIIAKFLLENGAEAVKEECKAWAKKYEEDLEKEGGKWFEAQRNLQADILFPYVPVRSLAGIIISYMSNLDLLRVYHSLNSAKLLAERSDRIKKYRAAPGTDSAGFTALKSKSALQP